MSLQALGITSGYRRNRPVLENVSLEIPSGKLIGLTGPSGTGKINACKDSRLAGCTVVRRSADRRITRSVGTKFSVPRGTTRHGGPCCFSHLAHRPTLGKTLASIIGQPGDIASRSIDVAALAAEVGLTPDLLSRRPHQVSDGQLQRACLARSLAQQPKYLICDEATAMLRRRHDGHAHSV